MNASRLLIVFVALVALVAVLAYCLVGSTDRSDTAAPASAGLTTPLPSSPAAAVPALAEVASPSREEAATVPAPVAAQGRDLTVVIDLPPDAPADAELAVVAVPASLLEGRSARELLDALREGMVAREGTVHAAVEGREARLRLPQTLEGPRLVVDGRFLYLPEPVAVSPDEDRVRVAPLLGACLVVQLAAPMDAELSGDVALFGGNFGGNFGGGFERRTLETSGAPELVFRAVDAGLTWMLLPDLDQLHGYAEMGVELEPGVELLLELELTRGATVAGEVLDDQGRPLEAVEVRAAGGGMWFGGGNARSAETDATGRFELAALPPGEVQVEAVDEGWVSAESETFELADGERVDGVRLTMSQGLAIAGRVLGDGELPAEGTEVSVETVQSRGGWGNWGGARRRSVGRATADADGLFRVTGLAEGKFTVRATLERGEDGDEGTWRAAEEGVAAGSERLVMTLAGPLPFEGRVVDDRGEPVASFEIVAEAARDGGPRETQSFDDEEGAFLFARVGPGTWEVTARAAGHVTSAPETVTLPANAAPLELRIERQATVTGQVFEGTGAPAAGATVRADDGSGGGNPWGGPSGPSAETDAEGRFELVGLTPGGLALTASSELWADSEDLALELTPGERREGAALHLRNGGGIVGTVVTAEGDPRPGRRVTWGSNAMGFGSRGETTTDAAGHFAFDRVTPGEWAVSAAATLAEMGRSLRGRSAQTAFVEAMGDLVTETVTVLDGEVVEVFLGGEPKRPVRVFGTVSRAGEPIRGAQVYAVSEGSAVFEGMKTTVAEVDGSYELIVDRPGPYSISANAGRIGAEVMVDVPRADEARVDICIPLGRIEGTVRAPDRTRAAGMRLSIQREDGLGRMRWAGAQATTDGDGNYAFEDLEAGSYTVRANVSGWGGPGGGAESSWGSAVLDGIVVEADAVTTGADFELETAGAVSGIVRDPRGTPAAGVSVFFRDAAGRLVSSVSGTRTNATGRFEESGLAPGTYTLSARADGLAASEAASVKVRSSETATIEFEVAVGTTLVVTLEDDEGAVSRSRVEVVDENGLEVGGLITVQTLQATFNEGASTREQRVGPLPPGRYTVRATTPDGRSKERRITLRGREEEKKVRLRLAD